MFDGIGLFFNKFEDLERIAGLAQRGKINWVTPLMAPDQDAVQHNRQAYQAWRDRLVPLGIKFAHWIWCDDPAQDANNAEWLVNNYATDGLVLNAEKAYEGAGKWKGKALMDSLMSQPATMRLPKLLSFEGTPADQFNMDYRSFAKAGCWFAPQAYWNQMPASTPRLLCDRVYLPYQIHENWDYRLWMYGKTGAAQKPWGRVVQQLAPNTASVLNLKNGEKYNLGVETKLDGTYAYMVCGPTRELKKGGKVVGKLLGFCERAKIVPTVGVYDPKPEPQDITDKLLQVMYITGASVYLGDTSEDRHVEATWAGVRR